MKQLKAHPLMIFSYIYPFLFVLVIPVVRGVLRYFLDRSFTALLVLETVLFALILINAVAKWLCCRINVYSDRVELQSGFLIKRTATVMKSRVSCISIERNPFDYMLGAVTVSVDTEAGERGKADFRVKIYRSHAKTLYSIVDYNKFGKKIKISFYRVAIMSAATSSAAVGVLVAAPIINRAGKLLNIALSQVFLDTINDVSKKMSGIIPPIVNVISLVFVGCYLVSFLLTLEKNIGMRVRISDENIDVDSGAFSRRRTCFKKSAVNNVIIDQTPLMRFIHRFLLKASIAGYGEQKGEGAVIIPSATARETRLFLRSIFGLRRSEKGGMTARNGTEFRFVKWFILMLSAVPVTAIVLTELFPAFSDLITFLSLVAVAIIIYFITLAEHNFNCSVLFFGRDTIFAHAVKGTKIREMFCRKDRIGVVKIRRYPVDFKKGTCNFTVIMRSESADSITVRHIDYNRVSEYCSESWEY